MLTTCRAMSGYAHRRCFLCGGAVSCVPSARSKREGFPGAPGRPRGLCPWGLTGAFQVWLVSGLGSNHRNTSHSPKHSSLHTREHPSRRRPQPIARPLLASSSHDYHFPIRFCLDEHHGPRNKLQQQERHLRRLPHDQLNHGVRHSRRWQRDERKQQSRGHLRRLLPCIEQAQC